MRPVSITRAFAGADVRQDRFQLIFQLRGIVYRESAVAVAQDLIGWAFRIGTLNQVAVSCPQLEKVAVVGLCRRVTAFNFHRDHPVLFSDQVIRFTCQIEQ